jgi:uncharacterized protein YfiM (DUF2279 family)
MPLKTVKDKVADVAVSTIGNAAGATVAPRTGLSKARSAVMRPAVIVAVVIAVGAYLLGLRRR